MGRRTFGVVGMGFALVLLAAPASAQVHVDVGVAAPPVSAPTAVGTKCEWDGSSGLAAQPTKTDPCRDAQIRSRADRCTRVSHVDGLTLDHGRSLLSPQPVSSLLNS